jgi:hypothetical protein
VAATKYLIKALLGNSFDLVSVAVRFWPISHTNSHDTTDVREYDLVPCPSLSLGLTRNERVEIPTGVNLFHRSPLYPLSSRWK